MRFECNWQRDQNSKWESRTFTGPNAQSQAKNAAEFWASMGAWNANWQAERPGQDNQPAWTARNGQRRN